MKKLMLTLLLSIVPALALATGDHSTPTTRTGPGMHQEDAHAAEAGHPGDAASVDRTIAIAMEDSMRFTPAEIHVKKGETIRFDVKNNGRIIHEMVIGVMSEIQEHADLMREAMKHMTPMGEREDEPNELALEGAKRGELLWTFSKAGDVYFACLVPGHFEAGMVGKIIVE